MHVDIGSADARRSHGNRQRPAGAGIERKRLRQRVGFGRNRAVQIKSDGIAPAFSLDIVDLQVEARLIAKRQKTRQRRLRNDRIADDHVLLCMADLLLRPGVRHHAHGAVEGGNVE
jgi:hypothetical protein